MESFGRWGILVRIALVLDQSTNRTFEWAWAIEAGDGDWTERKNLCVCGWPTLAKFMRSYLRWWEIGLMRRNCSRRPVSLCGKNSIPLSRAPIFVHGPRSKDNCGDGLRCVFRTAPSILRVAVCLYSGRERTRQFPAQRIRILGYRFEMHFLAGSPNPGTNDASPGAAISRRWQRRAPR